MSIAQTIIFAFCINASDVTNCYETIRECYKEQKTAMVNRDGVIRYCVARWKYLQEEIQKKN